VAATLAVLVALATLPDPTEKWPEAARKELKALQGRWTVEKYLAKDREEAPAEEQVVEIKGWFLLANGEVEAEFAAIDPGTSPKCLDLDLRDPDRKNPVAEGVFKLDGDTLTLCLYLGEGRSRPTGFDPPKDEGVMVAVLKRVKE
jgi:uncharacterized protein (TIGR03067 family)